MAITPTTRPKNQTVVGTIAAFDLRSSDCTASTLLCPILPFVRGRFYLFNSAGPGSHASRIKDEPGLIERWSRPPRKGIQRRGSVATFSVSDVAHVTMKFRADCPVDIEGMTRCPSIGTIHPQSCLNRLETRRRLSWIHDHLDGPIGVAVTDARQ